MTENAPFKTARIRLACGCNVVKRDIPVGRNQKFICESGMGHGYKGQSWTSWKYDGMSGENPPREKGGKV